MARFITLTWHVEDVIEQAAANDIKLIDEQALDILHLLKSEHDASIGINWEVIDTFIEMYLDGMFDYKLSKLNHVKE
jgi:hypothetical protein